jgi:uncharacterized Zn-finger protein
MVIAMDQQDYIFTIWMAGFYEGEGSISNDKSNNNRCRLSITQNDPVPLYKAKDKWGGNVRKRVRKSPVSDKICTCHEWNLSHNFAMKFIEDIKSFMIIPYKIQQVENVIEKSRKGNDNKYYCSFCNKGYANASGRRRHEKKEHIEKGVEFVCTYADCNKTYKSRDTLARHIKINHLKK